MRVEPHTVDSVVHVVKRGARGLPIVLDDDDRERFLKLLYYVNDEYQDPYWERSVARLHPFERPLAWPPRRPLVHILAYALQPNHFHLILKPLTEQGITLFMQRLCGSMTLSFNKKYRERGSIFQGAYRGITADLHGDHYLRFLAVYVMVKNPFELYEGGLRHAIREFDRAYRWACTRRWSSLGAYAANKDEPVLERDLLGEYFPSPVDFHSFAKECMRDRLSALEEVDQRLRIAPYVPTHEARPKPDTV